MSDFQAAWSSLLALEGPHYVIFNCGVAAGCSRFHKHLQVFEQNEEELLPDKLLRKGCPIDVPYRYILDQSNLPKGSSLHEAACRFYDLYQEHLAQCRSLSTLSSDQQRNSHIPHNVIFTRDWIMTIPRRQAGIGLATANAAGFLGLVWVPSIDVVEAWKEMGPRNVLATLGFAN